MLKKHFVDNLEHIFCDKCGEGVGVTSPEDVGAFEVQHKNCQRVQHPRLQYLETKPEYKKKV